MPLRDHFHSPHDDQTIWESIHGGWPMVMAQHLKKILPSRYVTGVRVHLGAQVEIDAGTFDRTEQAFPADWQQRLDLRAAEPTLAIETDLLDTDEYEVQVFDTKRNRRLVAAVEIVSPANKDRPEKRQSFVGKCEAMLRKGVSVSIVDLITYRHFNLYADLLALIGRSDPSMGDPPPATYAASCRWIAGESKRVLQTWSHALNVGQPLPTLPLWLAQDFAVPLDLEATYEETCATFDVT